MTTSIETPPPWRPPALTRSLPRDSPPGSCGSRPPPPTRSWMLASSLKPLSESRACYCVPASRADGSHLGYQIPSDHQQSIRGNGMQTMTRTQALVDRAKAVIPGGVNSINRVMPWPFAIASAAGAYLVDEDGRQLLDYHAAFGPIILGHCDPRVNAAVASTLDRVDIIGAGRHGPRGRARRDDQPPRPIRRARDADQLRIGGDLRSAAARAGRDRPDGDHQVPGHVPRLA